MLFSKIVPNCKKLGLLDRNDKWLRHRFEDMGVIQFEDWQDTGEEYGAFALGAEDAVPVAGECRVAPQRLRDSSASSLRIEMYSHTSVTIRPKPRYHSSSF